MGKHKLQPFSLSIMIITLIFLLLNIQCTKDKTHKGIASQPIIKAKTDDLKNTIVTPHLEQEIVVGLNVLWCNTFQLAWNEFCDLTGGPVQMESAPSIVPILNGRAVSKEDLDENSYVALAGLASEGIYEKIQKELEKKFKGQANPELLDSTPKMTWVTYAYLFKELPFQWAFTRFHERLIFGNYYVDSFGINQLTNIQKDEVKMASQVTILDYNNEDDFVIELKTQVKEDRLILAKVSPEKTLRDIISVVEKRIEKAVPTQMDEMSDLFVPVLDFDILHEYSELYSHPIHTIDKKLDGTEITVALQSTRFRLDERGAILKSESIFAAGLAPRNLVFDKPFLILLKRYDAQNPYFALWIGNTELLVPLQKKSATE